MERHPVNRRDLNLRRGGRKPLRWAIAWIGAALLQVQAAVNVQLWDTGTRWGAEAPADPRAGWKAVPTDLIQLEADPAKSSSDPGYYGREYTFQGDAVIENRALTVVFWSAKGRVAIYSRGDLAQPNGGREAEKGWGRFVAQLAPVELPEEGARIARCELVRHANDEVVVKAYFERSGGTGMSVTFGLDKSDVLQVTPHPDLRGVILFSPLEYAVAPSYIGDDFILGAADYPEAKELGVPARHLLVGLLQGEDRQLMLTWPQAKQKARLRVGEREFGRRCLEAIEVETAGQSISLAALSAPGIWHREALNATYLEKDVASSWTRPFPAKWTTQLSEGGVKATFAFRPNKGQIWRGVAGSYVYPVWFEGESARYHLGKKVAPQGESIVYFLEGRETPPWVLTPFELLKASVGRSLADSLIDAPGRKLRTHHRRGGEGVRRACTCGCTETIQAVFEAGQEVDRQPEISGDVEDMLYFVDCHVARIQEYQQMATQLRQWLQRTEPGDLKPLVEELTAIVDQIPQECEVQKENMKSPAYARELAQKTLALAGKKDPNNVKAYMELLKAWRDMGGAQDYVVAQCHTIARKLAQRAGYACATQPGALPIAEEVLRRCRECLRHADGYEIWADY